MSKPKLTIFNFEEAEKMWHSAELTLRGNQVCECGDYRHQHEDGKGVCKVCRYSKQITPPCQEFRLAGEIRGE